MFGVYTNVRNSNSKLNQSFIYESSERHYNIVVKCMDSGLNPSSTSSVTLGKLLNNSVV